jgi:hypothetical protein
MYKLFFGILILISCTQQAEYKETRKTNNKILVLNQKQAEVLSNLPLKCVQQEYPNKLGQVLNARDELKSPKQLHPAFYGCFDWHSAVHGHWLMVRLLKEFPKLKNKKRIREKLRQQLTADNIDQELAFFTTPHNTTFERTYGWAWILKLHQELATWKDAEGQQWASNLSPLADLIVLKYSDYLPKLMYPIRNGEHINTAFGLIFAFEYAKATQNIAFEKIILQRSKEFYWQDVNSPIQYEPSGYDFLSPSLEEADLMRRILTKSDFIKWLARFLPKLVQNDFDLAVGKVSDRSDGKMVHLDGLNFSRAWCLYGIGHHDDRYKHLLKIADKHLLYSLPSIIDGDYMGEHWLATFALNALLERNHLPTDIMPLVLKTTT